MHVFLTLTQGYRWADKVSLKKLLLEILAGPKQMHKYKLFVPKHYAPLFVLFV